MLIKVTAILEVMVHVETDDIGFASIRAREIVEENSYDVLRVDIGNVIAGEMTLATQRIKDIKNLPVGYDAETIAWGRHNTKCKDGI